MRNWRSFFLLRLLRFDIQKAPSFSRKNCIPYIPVGFLRVLPHIASMTHIVSNNNKQLVIKPCSTEEDFSGENFNWIVSAIENAPKTSAGEICFHHVDKLCKSGNLSAAARLLHFLQNKKILVSPNIYNLLLVKAGERNDIEILCQVFKDLVVSCKCLPSTSYFNLAKAFVNSNDHVQLLRLVNEVSELTFPESTMIMNKLIFAFGESGQFDKALLIFNQMKSLKCKPDLITYNTVLDILGGAGHIDDMLHEFASMKEVGIAPDFVSYNTLLNQLRKVGRLDLCLVYHRDMVESGIQPDLLTYTALIGSFGRAGNIEESLRLFNEMKMRQVRPSIYIYRSLINSLKKMGRLELAATLLEEMNASLSNLAGPKDFKRKGR